MKAKKALKKMLLCGLVLAMVLGVVPTGMVSAATVDMENPVFYENFSIKSDSNPTGTFEVYADYGYQAWNYSAGDYTKTSKGSSTFAKRVSGGKWSATTSFIGGKAYNGYASVDKPYYVRIVGGNEFVLYDETSWSMLNATPEVDFTGVKKIKFTTESTRNQQSAAGVRIYKDANNFIEFGTGGGTAGHQVYQWSKGTMSGVYMRAVKGGNETIKLGNGFMGEQKFTEGYAANYSDARTLGTKNRKVEWTVIIGDDGKVGWEAYITTKDASDADVSYRWTVANGLTGFDGKTATYSTTKSVKPTAAAYTANASEGGRFNFNALEEDGNGGHNIDAVYNDADTTTGAGVLSGVTTHQVGIFGTNALIGMKELAVYAEKSSEEDPAPIFSENFTAYDATNAILGDLTSFAEYGYNSSLDPAAYGNATFATRKDGATWTADIEQNKLLHYVKPVSGGGMVAKSQTHWNELDIQSNVLFSGIKKIKVNMGMNVSFPSLGALRIYTDNTKQNFLEFGLKGWRPAGDIWPSDNVSSAYMRVVKGGIVQAQVHNANVGTEASAFTFNGTTINHFGKNNKSDVEVTVLTDGEKVGWEVYAKATSGSTVCWRVANGLEGFDDRGNAQMTTKCNIPTTYNQTGNRFDFDDNAQIAQDYVYNDAYYENMFCGADSYTISLFTEGDDNTTFKSVDVYADASITPVTVGGAAKNHLRLNSDLLGNAGEFTAISATYNADTTIYSIDPLTQTKLKWKTDGAVMDIPESGKTQTVFVWNGDARGSLQPLMKPVTVIK